jgi:N-hydroxyarylamine O-acetyltransferase
MPNEAFDQKAWLVRIGCDGPLTPTLDGLHRLVAAHAYAIAYESLDIMLGRTPRLDLASLQSKMIGRNRGGYCLEQNMCSGLVCGRSAVQGWFAVGRL